MAKTIGLMRLGRDAEVRMVGDQQVANMSLAYNYGKKGADGNRPTQWIEAALWGKRAESLAPFLKKGSLHMFVVDDVHVETYTDKDGYEAFKLAGTISDVELGPKSEGGQGSSAPAAAGNAPARRQAPAPQPQRQAPAAGIDDDDIPF